MAKRSSGETGDKARFDLYDRLDRFEELLEDMAELGVSSRDEIEQKIVDLNRQIDDLEAGDE